MPMKAKLFFVTFWLALCPLMANAQDDGETEVSAEDVWEVLEPAFIVSFGGPGPLKYLKAEVTLRVPGGEAEANVKLHDPAIRHQLMLLLSRQKSENVTTPQAREQLRQVALEELRNLMVQEYEGPGYGMIKDLRFTSFVVQQ